MKVEGCLISREAVKLLIHRWWNVKAMFTECNRKCGVEEAVRCDRYKYSNFQLTLANYCQPTPAKHGTKPRTRLNINARNRLWGLGSLELGSLRKCPAAVRKDLQSLGPVGCRAKAQEAK